MNEPDLARPDRGQFGSSVDWLFEAIGNDIVSGVLSPGEKLSEPSLARRFGTSRGPLREALRRLEERNLVTREPRLGARVVCFGPSDFIALFQVREALEGTSARLAAERVSDADLADLRRVCEMHERHLHMRSDAFRQVDVDFHYRIAQLSANKLLQVLLCRDLYHFFRICRRQLGRMPGRAAQAIREHYRILEALEERDPELAELLMRRHIAAARRSLESVLSDVAAVAADTRRARRRRAGPALAPGALEQILPEGA